VRKQKSLGGRKKSEGDTKKDSSTDKIVFIV
jgi:hypothetical protein